MANYTLTENDYFDSEKEQYVITLPERIIIYSELSIIDEDDCWNCYLVSAKYNKKTNTYTLAYKLY